MSERIFEDARKAFEQLRRDFDDPGRRAHLHAERAIAEAYSKVAESLGLAETLLTLARRRGGRDGGPIPGLGRKPRRPGGGGASPQPAPVRPKYPNSLAGGAEAPLDP